MKKGFTLIEMLVVITILGILASIVSISYVNSQASARDSKRKADLHAISVALDQYRNDLTNQGAGSYPGFVGPADTLKNNLYNQLNYFTHIGRDPHHPGTQYYYSSTVGTFTGREFKLFAELERDDDAMARDGGQCSKQYEVYSRAQSFVLNYAGGTIPCN